MARVALESSELSGRESNVLKEDGSFFCKNLRNYEKEITHSRVMSFCRIK